MLAVVGVMGFGVDFDSDAATQRRDEVRGAGAGLPPQPIEVTIT